MAQVFVALVGVDGLMAIHCVWYSSQFNSPPDSIRSIIEPDKTTAGDGLSCQRFAGQPCATGATTRRAARASRIARIVVVVAECDSCVANAHEGIGKSLELPRLPCAPNVVYYLGTGR